MFGELYYRHSGRFSVGGVLAGLALGVGAAVVLAFVYAYAIVYVPLVYVSLLICAGYGAAIGLASARTMARFKVRSAPVMTLATVAAAAVGFYCSWMFWLYAMLRRADEPVELLTIFEQPVGVWRLILAINEEGAWSLSSRGEPVSGIALWIVWAAEAGVILGVPLWIARSVLAAPFCEQCETWCQAETAIGRLAMDDPDSFRTRLESKELAYLEKLGPPTADGKEWLQLDLYVCPKCAQTATVSAKHVTLTINKKGEAKTAEKVVVNKLLLTAAETDVLRQACGRIAAASNDARNIPPSTEMGGPA